MKLITAVMACVTLLTRGTALPEATPQEHGVGDDHVGSALLCGADSDTHLSSQRRGRDHADLSRDAQRADHAPCTVSHPRAPGAGRPTGRPLPVTSVCAKSGPGSHA